MPDQIDPATISEIEKLPSEEVKDAIADLLAPSETQKTPEQVKDEEFTALQDAAEHGYPLKPSTGPLFEVDKSAVIRLSHSSGVVFQNYPGKTSESRVSPARIQKTRTRPNLS